MRIERATPHQWASLSEDAHLAVFGTLKPATFDRIDYALLAVDSQQKPLAYLTARETDHETVYWQFGGSFPGARGTPQSYRAFQAFLRYTKEAGYKRVTCLVENTNTVFLKFVMKAGFLIQGVRMFKSTVLVEHMLEFK